MAIKSWTATGNGNWSTASAWLGGTPVNGDSVLIGNTTQAATFVTEDATLAVAALTIAGNHKANQGTTLSLTQAATLTVNGPLIFDADSIITGSGTLVANGAISGGGLIIAADSGTIDVTGTGSIASDVVLDFSASTTLGSTLKLDLSGGVTSAGNIRMNNANQSLIIGPSTSLTINAAEVVSKGTLRMLGGTVTDSLGITVGGQGATGTIIGFGTIAASVTGGGVKGVVDTITASGGTLDLIGIFTDGAGGTFVPTIDSASPSTLKFDNTATVAQPIAMSTANQTLEIGAAGALTLTGLEIVGGGTIRMDGGTLTDVSGIGINAPAVLVGKGTVTAGTALSGDGTVKASGGTLELGAGLTATTMAFDVDTVAGSVLRVDGAVAPGVTLSFLGASGVLELADVVGGVLQGFSGTIAGLNVGPVSTAPTNELNIQAPITKAVVSGRTLTLLNGATTVATLALSATPVAGTYGVIQADAALGGSDVFLTNAPPPSITGVTATAIAGVAEAKVSVAVFDGATQIGTVAADAGGAWSLPFVLAAGKHTLSAKATAIAGNVGTTSPALAAIIGTAGDDTLVSGTGVTVMIGGAGNDAYTVNNGLDVVTDAAGSGTADTVRSSVNYALAADADIERLAGTGTTGLVLTGNDIANSITGTTGNDTLNGGGGNDVLNGGVGADSMAGGAGNDTYFVDNALDVVVEGKGQGTDLINASVSYSLAAGSEVETLSVTSATGIVLTGNEFANTLFGGAGNDTLNGGAGDDKFRAKTGDGNDTYDGGTGIDTYDLSLTTAGATVNLGLGTATSAATGSDTLISIENVTGSAGDDTFVASVGDGNNVYNGGAGIDTYDLSATTANAVVNLLQGKASSLDIGSDTLSVNTIENVTGGAGNDTLTGDTHNNLLVGGAGNDVLTGGVGADTMAGGAGNDTYFVDNIGDVVNEVAGEGTDKIVTSVSYTLSAAVEALTGSSAAGLVLTGNALDNTITSGNGNDTMAGGLGNDAYFVNNTGDVVNETTNEGTDTVWSSTNYTLAASSEVETLRVNSAVGRSLTGNAFSHALIGGAGNDVLTGGTGNDTLNGGAGADVMAGGAGSDTYSADNAGDVVHELVGGGSDTVFANVDYTLTAGAEVEFLRANAGATGLSLTGNDLANTIVGASGGDTLSGGGGNDTLNGGVGNDVLIGGTGNDVLNSGAGSDIFRFLAAGFGNDVTDFAAGLDKLDISALGITAATFASKVQIAGAGSATVTIGADTIRLNGVAAANVHQSDFILA